MSSERFNNNGNSNDGFTYVVIKDQLSGEPLALKVSDNTRQVNSTIIIPGWNKTFVVPAGYAGYVTPNTV